MRLQAIEFFANVGLDRQKRRLLSQAIFREAAARKHVLHLCQDPVAQEARLGGIKWPSVAGQTSDLVDVRSEYRTQITDFRRTRTHQGIERRSQRFDDRGNASRSR